MLRSLASQTHQNWELCICNDGDRDQNVIDYLDGLVRKDPQRFKLIAHKKNRGIAAATRSALTLVSGDVVAFVDADDLLHPRALEVASGAFAADDEIDFIYTNHDFSTDLGFRFNPVIKPGWSPELLQICNYINHLSIVRKSCLDRCPDLFPEGSRGEPEKMQPFKTGVARLVEGRPELRVVPVFMRGLGKALPKGDPIPVPVNAEVRFGEPRTYGGSMEEILKKIEADVRELGE